MVPRINVVNYGPDTSQQKGRPKPPSRNVNDHVLKLLPLPKAQLPSMPRNRGRTVANLPPFGDFKGKPAKGSEADPQYAILVLANYTIQGVCNLN
jgi:hypothetical protein